MSADEDNELRDLVAQTLETNGVLGKIRAQLRASVFLALEEQDSVQNKTPFVNQDLKKFMSTKDGHAVIELIREFLDCFNLEFTKAVFDPEAGCSSSSESRASLAKEFNIQESASEPKLPVLLEVLKRSQGEKTAGSKSASSDVAPAATTANVPQELTQKQLADARKKFDQYDRDKNSEIDKEELRELFVDLFPNFNRNMLDRYVNDEFRAADRDISNSISFQEFVSMYKRLFLQCRSVVSGDVADILSPSSPNKSISSPLSKASNSERSSHIPSRGNGIGSKMAAQENNNTDTEEDFFDDPIPSSTGYKAFGSKDDLSSSSDTSRRSSGRPSQIPVFSALRSDDKQKSPTTPGVGKPGGQGQTGGMSSLQGLPSLTGDKSKSGRKSRQLPVFTGRHHSHGSAQDRAELLRSDKRMAELGLDGDVGDYSYEDDFVSEGHSLSQRSPRNKSEAQNGSIAEEIEEDLELSIDGDLLPSEKSAFDDITTDRTISQHEAGFDYMEELQSP